MAFTYSGQFEIESSPGSNVVISQSYTQDANNTVKMEEFTALTAPLEKFDISEKLEAQSSNQHYWKMDDYGKINFQSNLTFTIPDALAELLKVPDVLATITVSVVADFDKMRTSGAFIRGLSMDISEFVKSSILSGPYNNRNEWTISAVCFLSKFAVSYLPKVKISVQWFGGDWVQGENTFAFDVSWTAVISHASAMLRRIADEPSAASTSSEDADDWETFRL